MKEIRQIVKAYSEAQQQGIKAALATVVLVEGSAYRRPGARMLVTADGHLTGAISGGCLEGDALRKARLAMDRGEAVLVTYDTTDEDDAKFGVGLGCNGIIHVLIEPIDDDKPDNPIEILKALQAKRQYAVVATLFSLTARKAQQLGTCALWTKNGAEIVTLANGTLKDKLLNDAEAVFNEKRSATQAYIEDGAQYTGLIELIEPEVALVIVGAGNDAIPLVQMADILGWQCTVIDGRPNYVTKSRFELANRLIVAKPADVPALIEFDEQTVLVLMTHNYNYEYTLLKYLLNVDLPYLGILGPRKKLERMLAELETEGVFASDDSMARVHSPVGLDIGAEGAEEIALAIAAEIKAVLSLRNGRSLKYKPVPIHADKF